ncbi:MAG: hypothetical protein ACODAB_10080 [Gemmatimonadota bacterium]
MPFEIATADDYQDLLDRVRRFATGVGTIDSESFSGDGDGTLEDLDTTPDTVDETWTIECTDDSTEGEEVWSVTGSVSGAQDDATTGEDYANDYISFRVEAGDTAFSVGDEFTVTVEQGELAEADEAWDELRWREDPDDAGERELILRGPGLADQDEIYVSIMSYSSESGDYYNWALRGHTGFVDDNDTDSQPGTFGPVAVLLFQSSIPYWLSVTGRRINLVARVSTRYMSCGLGLIRPQATPDEYPYPVYIGGCIAGAPAERWDREESDHAFPWDGPIHDGDRMRVRFVDGSTQQYNVHPFENEDVYRPLNGDEDYALERLILSGADPENVIGYVDGIYHITGFGLSAEDIVPVDGVDHLVVPNIYRNGFNDYVAFALE